MGEYLPLDPTVVVVYSQEYTSIDCVSGPLSPVPGSSKCKRGHRGGSGRGGVQTDGDHVVVQEMSTDQADQGPAGLTGELSVMDFMQVIIDQFAAMFLASDSADVAPAATVDGGEPQQQTADVPPEHDALVDPDFNMDVKQYGQSENVVAY